MIRIIPGIICLMLSACNGSSSPPVAPPPPPPAPAAPVAAIDVGIKQLIVSWNDIPAATQYKLLENPDGHSGFSQVGTDIASGTLSVSLPIATHFHDFANALYIVQACNSTGCTSSSSVGAADKMLDTIGYFKAPNTGANDYFGTSVAVSADGTVMAIGAPGEDSDPAALAGDMNDDGLTDSGAVYVYEKVNGTWEWRAILKASNADSGDRFGATVALNADGTILAVGAPQEDSAAITIDGDQDDNSWPDAGAVYVFRLEGGAWSQRAYLKASIRGSEPPNVRAFEREQFGFALALNSPGDRLVVGEPGHPRCVDNQFSCASSGAAHIFDTDGTDWVYQAYLGLGVDDYDSAGYAVALTPDGSRVAISAPGRVRDFIDNPGAVYVLDHEDGVWEEDIVLPPNDPDGYRVGDSGAAIALSADGNTLAISMHDGSLHESRVFGYIMMFSHDGSGWNDSDPFPETSIRPPKPVDEYVDEFARALAISADGQTLAVGAFGEMSKATGVNGDEADESLNRAGAAYMYQLEDGNWVRKAFIKATNTGSDDYFGTSIALTPDATTLAVGAYREDSGAVGIDGDPDDNSAENAGAVFIY